MSKTRNVRILADILARHVPARETPIFPVHYRFDPATPSVRDVHNFVVSDIFTEAGWKLAPLVDDFGPGPASFVEQVRRKMKHPTFSEPSLPPLSSVDILDSLLPLGFMDALDSMDVSLVAKPRRDFTVSHGFRAFLKGNILKQEYRMDFSGLLNERFLSRNQLNLRVERRLCQKFFSVEEQRFVDNPNQHLQCFLNVCLETTDGIVGTLPLAMPSRELAVGVQGLVVFEQFSMFHRFQNQDCFFTNPLTGRKVAVKVAAPEMEQVGGDRHYLALVPGHILEHREIFRRLSFPGSPQTFINEKGMFFGDLTGRWEGQFPGSLPAAFFESPNHDISGERQKGGVNFTTEVNDSSKEVTMTEKSIQATNTDTIPFIIEIITLANSDIKKKLSVSDPLPEVRCSVEGVRPMLQPWFVQVLLSLSQYRSQVKFSTNLSVYGSSLDDSLPVVCQAKDASNVRRLLRILGVPTYPVVVVPRIKPITASKLTDIMSLAAHEDIPAFLASFRDTIFLTNEEITGDVVRSMLLVEGTNVNNETGKEGRARQGRGNASRGKRERDGVGEEGRSVAGEMKDSEKDTVGKSLDPISPFSKASALDFTYLRDSQIRQLRRIEAMLQYLEFFKAHLVPNSRLVPVEPTFWDQLVRRQFAELLRRYTGYRQRGSLQGMNDVYDQMLALLGNSYLPVVLREMEYGNKERIASFHAVFHHLLSLLNGIAVNFHPYLARQIGRELLNHRVEKLDLLEPEDSPDFDIVSKIFAGVEELKAMAAAHPGAKLMVDSNSVSQYELDFMGQGEMAIKRGFTLWPGSKVLKKINLGSQYGCIYLVVPHVKPRQTETFLG
ncbi:hypothetical protein BABINDRAFT_161983 [Babjeviella inositovora NRRL Y-12698]|uniref:Uncharacterized protein n=1 Tax=Babjeviella inositovora NRRL Y-12698 TaxID=984486 RepID=A0A1E3QPM3_9ASCO|nr:uncharacterized protein BABINDRAFT_161983 [Babjeviella inositovora NRRL Y-12698]ODQ79600.1 hypothetical protein BABINDRAFT_161983 [Babjeviella inositovora NRRL Y-12698]